MLCRAGVLALGCKQEEIVSVPKVVNAGDASDSMVHFREVDIREQARDRGAERDAEGGPACPCFVLIFEAYPLSKNLEEVIGRVDEFRQLCDQQFMVNTRKIIRNVSLYHVERSRARANCARHLRLATVEAVTK